MADNKLLVAAIDFGSSGAGYGFSFAYQYTTNPIDVHTSIWSANNSNIQTKVPTVLLFDEKQKFDSFGFEAEDKYEELVSKGEQGKWYFFRGFKMQLYNAVENDEDIRGDFELFEIGGKQMSAKIVFSTAIGFLKDHFIGEISSRNLGVIVDMIHWVVTVPAIWNDSCKQFMRESAEKTGIKGKDLSIVYEPEAASIYARLLPVDRFTGENNEFVIKAFDPGRKFIVLDAGGGTVDISTQQVSPKGELNIIHRVCGGPWGGECVNRQFMKILSIIIGKELLKDLQKGHGHELLELTRNFERRKRAFKVNSEDRNVQVTFPFSFIEFVENRYGKTFPNLIRESELCDQMFFKRDKLSLSRDIFISLFDDTCRQIIEETKTILRHPRCSDVSAIMMAGGFSEADLLQKAIQDAFPDIKVYVPFDGSLSVLKGAVVYGHNPNVVSSRVCNFTYGFDICTGFDPSIHSEEKCGVLDGRIVCFDIFRVLYTIDEEVKIGDNRSIPVSKTFITDELQPFRPHPIKIEFYVSDRRDTFYVTDEGCKHHATISVFPPGGVWPVIETGKVELEIAGTELIGTYISDISGEKTSGKFEFLPAKAKQMTPRRRIFDPFYLDI